MSQDLNRRAFMGTAAAVAAAAGLGAVAAEQPVVKIVGIATSMRKGKTTAQAVQMALESARTVSPAIQTELIELSGLNLDPYLAIGAKSVDRPDDFELIKAKLTDPQVHGVILGSPVYMGMVSSPCKAMFERMIAFRSGGFPLQGKVGGAIAVGAGRNTGQEVVLQQLIMFMMSQGMCVVGDGKPTSHWGGTVWNNNGDDISKDGFGSTTVKGMGRRVAETALKLAGVQ